MFKSVLLATSMLVAAPVFAQDKPATETTQTQPQTPPAQAPAQSPATTDDAAPGTQGSGTVEEAPAAATAPATEAAQPSPTQPAAPTQPGAAPAQPATPAATPGTSGAGTAAAQPAAAASTPEQVTQAVGRDFGTYDKDANGSLTQAEFGTWVGTLRKASEPAFVPGSPEANVWLGQAFAAADTDKNKSVNQAELATFLTPKP